MNFDNIQASDRIWKHTGKSEQNKTPSNTHILRMYKLGQLENQTIIKVFLYPSPIEKHVGGIKD